jgi:hypothetical protein
MFKDFIKNPEKDLDENLADRARDLDRALREAYSNPSTYAVATDASVPRTTRHQAVSAYMVYRSGILATQARYVAGRVSAPDAELFAIRGAVVRTIQYGDCNHIILFTDSIAMARRAVDPSVHSGQGHSLAVCSALEGWFGVNPHHHITFYQVPSKARWDIHFTAHEYVHDMPPIGSGPHPATSLTSVRYSAARSCRDAWTSEFQTVTYRGGQFMMLRKGLMAKNPTQPSYAKGGSWLPLVPDSLSLAARLCRCILGHAPMGEYYSRFNIPEYTSCRCGAWLQTRSHILSQCAHYERGFLGSPEYLGELIDFLRANPSAFAFNNPPEGIG